MIAALVVGSIHCGSDASEGPNSESDASISQDGTAESAKDARADVAPDVAVEGSTEASNEASNDVSTEASNEASVPPGCGNNQVDPGEACDGTDLAGMSCTSVWFGHTSGTLACKGDCSGFDASACAQSGTTVTAASCSQPDVQAAIDSSSDGDTVHIPAGTCTWTTPVNSTKAIRIAGAGTSSTIIVAAVDQALNVHIVPRRGQPERVAVLPATRVRDPNAVDALV